MEWRLALYIEGKEDQGPKCTGEEIALQLKSLPSCEHGDSSITTLASNGMSQPTAEQQSKQLSQGPDAKFLCGVAVSV